MSKAFYRKYRSKRLEDVVGQNHITDILARAVKDGKVAHAYLFTGPRGVGKTSIARILAHEINQLPYDDDSSHLDIIEIDAASNNGVDDIRDLRERVRLAPVSAPKKVYIIDEVHMLSKPAFNALLKTLEEPPEHAVFILATTDADKLPATIISRTQRFNFRTVPTNEVIKHLGWIAKQEGFAAEEEALRLIAVHGEGTFRDSIGLLDQLQSAADKKTGITKGLVESFLGLPPTELVEQLLAAYEAKNLTKTIELLDNAERAGAQTTMLTAELIRHIRENISTKPQLLPLLDALLEVPGSSRPNIKLLTTLAANSAPKPKVAALSVAAPAISAPVEAIEAIKKPLRLKPKVTPTPAAKAPKVPEATNQPTAAAPRSTPAVPPADFDWNKIIEHVRANYIAIFSVLSKCSHHISGSTLTIYTGNAFYKKKLDDSRYRATLSASLDELGMSGFTIDIVGSAAPPKDELAASIAALMGGGEEVALTEDGREA